MVSDYKDILSEFKKTGVEYMVVGAHALAAHGIIRASIDFDIWVRASEENAQKIWRALIAFGAPLHDVTQKDFSEPGLILQIGAAPNCIHLMTSVSGVDFEQAWQRRVHAQLPTLDYPAIVIGRDDLIKNKKASGRKKDLLDVDDLENNRTR